ncbi:hypothetical protein LY76DRAFT_376135 [Colletotrichum caudatum]|nr:hypothetical protein LY76DRAFT_376135 [Colletotrichum caudatum]
MPLAMPCRLGIRKRKKERKKEGGTKIKRANPMNARCRPLFASWSLFVSCDAPQVVAIISGTFNPSSHLPLKNRVIVSGDRKCTCPVRTCLAGHRRGRNRNDTYPSSPAPPSHAP